MLLVLSRKPTMRTFLIALLISISTQAGANNDITNNNLVEAVEAIDANVIFMRHALAPGFGDPISFNVTDCSTQRNLNDVGRAQARSIGKAMLNSGFRFNEVLSSQWCRCTQTAELLNLGHWNTFSGLNSFFQDHANKQITLDLLHRKLASLGHGLTLMVTHQVVISAITNHVVGSGALVAYNSTTFEAQSFTLE
jgi:phosphohistidine phosphatase SixA